MSKKEPLTYEKLRAFALSLGLPGIADTVSWGQPTLKAHGKLWLFWSPQENAPAFKVSIDERAMLVEADPETFYYTPHYKNHPWVLVRPDRVDLDWVRVNLMRVWREQAPKKLLKEFDARLTAPPSRKTKRAVKRP